MKYFRKKTTIQSRLFPKSEGKPGTNFFIGLAVAMEGVALIRFNGSRMEWNLAWASIMGTVLTIVEVRKWMYRIENVSW